MGSEAGAERAYAVFESKVTRTVYIDNLSPDVTESLIKAAIEQYATVINVQFIPNYTERYLTSRCALVELEKAKQASYVVEVLNSYPFMISGMPRPVRAQHAEAEMFEDRPPKPGRKVKFCWIDSDHKDFKVKTKLMELAIKHQAESAYMLKLEREEEEKLAETQAEFLKRAYKQHVLMEENLDERSLNCLLQYYKDTPGSSEIGHN